MTQVWPVFGVAPVPSLLSMICKPEAVVMGFFPAVWADASWAAIGVETAAAMAARAVRIIVRREDRISVYLVRETDVSSPRWAISIAIFRAILAAGGHVSAAVAAVTIDRKICQQRRSFAGDQVADQARGQKAEGDAVATIAVGRIDALGAGERADQRQPIMRGIERPRPAKFDLGPRDRPECREPLHQRPRFLGDQTVARLRFDNLRAVLAADDDASRPRRSRIEI